MISKILLTNSKLRYGLLALLIFTSGYFLFYGYAAHLSGSWKYVMRTSDDALYWATAKEMTESPSSTANPYYYEDLGKTQSIPYPMVSLIGWLAKISHLPVLFFFPLGNILIPFLLWLALFWSLTKIWGYRETPSALMALFFLLSTLWVRDVSHYLLFRFSRPADGLWFVFILLSMVMHPEKIGRKGFWLGLLMAFAILWFNPYLLALIFPVIFFECLRKIFREKNKRDLFFLGGCLLSVAISVLLYRWFVFSRMGAEAAHLPAYTESSFLRVIRPEWSSFLLYGAIVFLVTAGRFFLKSPLSKLDRLMIFLFLVEPIFGNLQLILPQKMLTAYHKYPLFAELAYHRYAYFVIEIAVLTGWAAQKTPLLVQKFKGKAEKTVIGLLFILLGWILLTPKHNFLRFIPGADAFGMKNPHLILTLVPAILLWVWAFYRFSAVRKVLSSTVFVLTLLGVMTAGGYYGLARQSYDPKTHIYQFQNYPFDGALRWFRQNASSNAVVLTAAPTRLDIDYLSLYTDCKSFIHPFGEIMAEKSANSQNTFRFLFYYNLLLDDWKGFQYEGIQSARDKLSRVKLDYLLLELPSPYLPNILKELEGHLEEVYRDDSSLIFKLNP